MVYLSYFLTYNTCCISFKNACLSKNSSQLLISSNDLKWVELTWIGKIDFENSPCFTYLLACGSIIIQNISNWNYSLLINQIIFKYYAKERCSFFDIAYITVSAVAVCKNATISEPDRAETKTPTHRLTGEKMCLPHVIFVL